MPFTRARHDGSSKPATPHPTSNPSRPVFGRTARLLAVALTSLFLVPSLTGTASATGVPGWTTGSQTYLRVRPDVTTPPVAKVPSHTKIFIWGKKHGWYRVETPDNKLGWVYFDYIKSDSLHKVKELSDKKAKLASDRGSSQQLYGNPQLLKKYYARFGSKGAAEGLAMHGIYVDKPKVAKAPVAKKPVAIAKAAPIPKPEVKQPVVAKVVIAPKAEVIKPVVAKVVTAAPAPRIDLATNLTPVKALSPIPVKEPVAEAPASSKLPSFPTVENTTPVPANVSKPVAVLIPSTTEAPVTAKLQPSLPPQSKVTFVPARPVAKTKKDVNRDQLRKQFPIASRSKTGPVAVAPVSPEELIKAREQYLNNRNQRMGGLPVGDASGPVQVAPAIGTGVPAIAQPSSFKKESLEGPRVLGGPVVVAHSLLRPRAEDRTAPRQEEEIRHDGESSANEVAVAAAPVVEKAKPEVILAKNTPSKTEAKPAPQPEAKAEPAKKEAPRASAQLAYRGGSPRDRYANMRGGSPRDRYAANFGKGVAQQALGYRGMPYRRGAASPSRGFDCSGLVYYCLRQRGLNPPRTAAGYAGYGKAVPAGQMKEGDLVLFANTYKRGVSHIGVYLGGGKFVHAATSGTGVRVDYLNSAYYSRKFYGARRVQ